MSFLSPKKQLRWIMGLYQKAKWKMTFWGISFSNISVVVVKSSLFHVLEKCADIPTMHLIFTPCREIQKIRSAHKKRTFQKNILKAIDIYVLMEICLLVLCAFNTLFYDLWNGEGYFTPRVGFIFWNICYHISYLLPYCRITYSNMWQYQFSLNYFLICLYRYSIQIDPVLLDY